MCGCGWRKAHYFKETGQITDRLDLTFKISETMCYVSDRFPRETYHSLVKFASLG